jgi:hydrogenase maturation factor
MCRAPVGKVITIEKGRLTVEYNGRLVGLRSNLQQIKTGDYVLFSSGIAIDKIDEEEALTILGAHK